MSLENQKRQKYFEYNTATFSGALDIIVVEDEKKNLRSTEFHVTIGNMRVMNVTDKTIVVKINGFECKQRMKLNGNGAAYFETFEYIDQTQSPDSGSKSTLEVDPQSGEAEIFLQMAKKKKNSELNVLKKVNQFQLSTTGNNVADAKLIEISFSAHLIKPEMCEFEIDCIFDSHRITFEEFRKNPNDIINNPNLLIRLNGKIYDSFFGIPQLLSLNVFQKELENQNSDELPERKAKTFSVLGTPKIAILSQKSRRAMDTPDGFFDSVPLHEGKNRVEYIVKGNFGKEHVITTNLYFYPYRKQFRIVVSDIDGTITKSDILGHLMPMVGQQWTHDGIARLYSNLAKRGYTIIYLSARHIGKSEKTKEYLRSINQGGYRMPDGPVLTSTDDMFVALQREMIKKTPHFFKIKLLKKIYQVFGNGKKNPLYGGFGNKDTDAIAYSSLSIETKKIFTINEKSEIKVLKNGNVVTFTNLNASIDETFPIFDPNEEIKENDLNMVKRNKTNAKVIIQSLLDPVFKEETLKNLK